MLVSEYTDSDQLDFQDLSFYLIPEKTAGIELGGEGLHSTEVAFVLLTQLALVRIPALLRFFLLNCFVRGQH